ncbi:MAG: NAD-dependent deacetylase [Acidobacteriota bacterium]|jgi:NAD-dependent deacetylase|nr:NAD-dependent deacetylase [Acidobacteriota bacterium]
MATLAELVGNSKVAAAFTGAGVSTLCGIPDFRGPQGLYKTPGAERMFDIDVFREEPELFYTGGRELTFGLRKYSPGPVHTALARLEARGRLQGVVTQNIDMLHQKAGSKVVHELHGSPHLSHCVKCGAHKSFEEMCALLEGALVPTCERCGGVYKPDVVFFGEALPEKTWRAAERLAGDCDLMFVLGSSLTVFPAAQIPEHAVNTGARLVIANAQPTVLDRLADLHFPDLADFAAELDACL